MHAVDTNVLLRLLVADDAAQVSAAEAFMAQGAWVSHLVLAETAWVLESTYELGPEDIARSFEMALGTPQLTFENPEVVARALTSFRARPKVDFVDCLILEIARQAGHLPLGTFDRDLAKLDGAQRVS